MRQAHVARLVQVGVVSWGLECGLAVPGVYADITRPEVQEAGCSAAVNMSHHTLSRPGTGW